MTGYVGIAEAQRRTQMPAKYLRRIADAGILRAVRDPSGRRLLRRDDIEQFMTALGERP